MSVTFPFFEMTEAFHVGTMDAHRRGVSYATSYEGRLLSISNCPNAWRQIAHLDGDQTFALAIADKLLLDIHGIKEAARLAIADWSESLGLAERAIVFRGWEWDADEKEWRYSDYSTADEAEGEVRFFLDLDDGEPIPTNRLPKGKASLIEPVEVLSLTKAGKLRSGWIDEGDAADIVAAFYAEDVLALQDDRVVGVWWNDRYSPQSLSAPRGGIFPSALPRIEVIPNVGWVPDGGKLRRKVSIEFDRRPAQSPAI